MKNEGGGLRALYPSTLNLAHTAVFETQLVYVLCRGHTFQVRRSFDLHACERAWLFSH